MLLSYPLPLNRQLVPLLSISFYFCLYVLLVTSRVHKALSAAFDIQIFLVKSLHFQLNQLIFKLIQLNFCVHSVNLVSELTYNCLNFLDVILNFRGYTQERLLFCLILILYCLEFLQNLLSFLELWSQGAFLLSNLFQKFLNLFVDLLNRGVFDGLICNKSLSFNEAERFFVPGLLFFQQLLSSGQVAGFPFNLLDFLFTFGIFCFFLFKLTQIVLKFIFLKSHTLNFVDLFFLFTNFCLKS